MLLLLLNFSSTFVMRTIWKFGKRVNTYFDWAWAQNSIWLHLPFLGLQPLFIWWPELTAALMIMFHCSKEFKGHPPCSRCLKAYFSKTCTFQGCLFLEVVSMSVFGKIVYFPACLRSTIKWGTVMIGQSRDFSCLLTNFPRGRIKKKHCTRPKHSSKKITNK